MYARQSNLSGMFEHLHALSKRKYSYEGEDIGVNANRMSVETVGREADLDVIRETEGDITGKHDGFEESSEMILAEESNGNIPIASQKRRSTMMTELTVFTEPIHDFSSDDNLETDRPPWVDRVQLRHGMDWLDLTK